MTYRKSKKAGVVSIMDAGGWSKLYTDISADGAELSLSVHEYRSFAGIGITKREAKALRKALDEFIEEGEN